MPNTSITVTLPQAPSGTSYNITNNSDGIVTCTPPSSYNLWSTTTTTTNTHLTYERIQQAANRVVNEASVPTLRITAGQSLQLMQEAINEIAYKIAYQQLLYGTSEYKIMFDKNDSIVPLTSLQKEINDLESMGYRE